MSDQSLRDALEKLLATTDGWTVSNETLLAMLAAHPAESARDCICIKDVGEQWVLDRTGLLEADPACSIHGRPAEPAPVVTDEAVEGLGEALAKHADTYGMPFHIRKAVMRDVAPLLGRRPAPDRKPSDAAVEALTASMFESVHEMDWSMAEGVVRAQWLKRGRAALEAAYRVDAPRPLLDREAARVQLREMASWAEPVEYVDETTDAVMEMARPMPTEDTLTQWIREIYNAELKAPTYREAALKLLALLNGAE